MCSGRSNINKAMLLPATPDGVPAWVTQVSEVPATFDALTGHLWDTWVTPEQLRCEACRAGDGSLLLRKIYPYKAVLQTSTTIVTASLEDT